jgi:multiple sugar transport system permease protein
MGAAPVFTAVVNSFFFDYGGDREFAGLTHYRTLFSDKGFAFSLRISVLWAFLNTVVTIGGGFLIALSLIRRNLTSKSLFLSLILPWGIPAVILVPLWRLVIHGVGGASFLSINLLTDPFASFFATVFVSSWMSVPLIAFVFAGALKAVPSNLADAARAEGAGGGTIALWIYLPMIRETVLALGLLTFVRSLKEFSVILLLTAGGPPLVGGFAGTTIIGATTTLEIYLYELFMTTYDFGLLSAYSVVLIFLVVISAVLWVGARRQSEKTRGVVLILVAAAGLVFGGLWGVAAAVAYIASIRFGKALLPVFMFDLALNVVHIAVSGFPAGLNPALIIAAVAVPITIGGSSPVRRGGAFLTPARILAAVTAVLSSLVIVYMLVWVSFSAADVVYVDRLLPRFFTAENFRQVAQNPGVLRSFGNTAVLSFSTALLTPLVTFPAAFWILRQRARTGEASLIGIQLVTVIGGMHTLIPLYWIFMQAGLVGSYIPLIMIYIAHTVPFAVFTMVSFLRSMPRSFRDTAALEGISPFGYLRRILLPLSAPAIGVTMMAAFIGAWNSFLAPLVFLTDDSTYPISLTFYNLIGTIGSAAPRWGLFAAASAINIVVVLAVMVPATRSLTRTNLHEV